MTTTAMTFQPATQPMGGIAGRLRPEVAMQNCNIPRSLVSDHGHLSGGIRSIRLDDLDTLG